MLTRQSLQGVWHALLVPWGEDDRPNLSAFRNEVRAFANTGIDGVYTGGTTGEFYAQDDESFAVITRTAVEAGHEIGLPVQIGCTTLSTRTTCLRIHTAVGASADGIQVALPFWLEMSDDEVIRFIEDCAEASGDTPLVLYLTTRSKRKMSPQLLAEAAERVPKLIGTKDTGATPEEVRQMSEASGLSIFGGEDFYTRLPVGGRGGYCSVTGLAPRTIVRLFQLCRDDRLDEARALQVKIDRLFDEVLIPMVDDGLQDSAIDRIQRAAGGGQVGLRCQRPYRSGTDEHVQRVIQWCQAHAPELQEDN